MMEPVVLADAPYESKDDPTVKLRKSTDDEVKTRLEKARSHEMLSQSFIAETDNRTRQLVWTLLGSTLICAICLIIGLEHLDTSIPLIIIVIISIIVSILSSYMIYQWEIIKYEINIMENNNSTFESSNLRIKSDKNKLNKEVNILRGRIKILNKDLNELNERLSHFEKLKIELLSINENNIEMDNMITSLNELINDMKYIAYENEKAYLYELYYTYEFRDNKKGLNKSEYSRLLTRLPLESRKLLENGKTFEQIAGNDNIISFDEFQGLIKDYLSQLETKTLDQFPNAPKM